MLDLEQVIRERAYHLWVEGGCEHGNENAHWLAAQREILNASLDELGRVETKANLKAEKPKKVRAPRKRRAA